MKVLFISHHGALGGAERSLLELLAGLGGRGVKLMLACPAPGPLAEAAVDLGVRVFPLNLCRLRRRPRWDAFVMFLSRWVWVTVRLIRIIVVECVDLVHTNSSMAQLWSWPAIRITRRPFVWHWRDFYDAPRINRPLATGRGTCIAVSRSVLDFAKRQMGASASVVLVPNGVIPLSTVPTPASVMLWRRERGVGPSECLAVAMGQAIPRKGFSILIRALALAQPKCANLRAFLACQLPDEESRSHLRKLRAAVVEHGCEAILMVADEIQEPGMALCAADVVVIPSLREPFGRVSVEAMLVGKPTICSDVDGLAEIVEDGLTGILVPAGDAHRLSEALVAMASNPERRRNMGERGRQHALEQFSIQRTVDGVLRAYKPLCGFTASAPSESDVKR